jgi:hypothetical protein
VSFLRLKIALPKWEQAMKWNVPRVVRFIVATVFFVVAADQALGQEACSLTDAQTRKAIDVWAKIANFLTSEPRCVNCHGRVNPYIDGVGLDPEDPFKDAEAPVSQVEHGGGKQKHENTGLMDQGCKKCHDGMASKRDGSPSVNWTLAPNFLSFVDKDATTLCRQIKRATHTADGFLGHLQDDEGRTNFAGTAFLGNRGLGEDSLEGFNLKVQVPSLTHEAVMKLGKDWVDAMGGRFQGDEGCGCEVRHSQWSGRIHYAAQSAGDDGHNDLQDWSARALTTVTVTVSNGVGTYHGHVENRSHAEDRQAVALGGGKVTFEKRGVDDVDGSGDGTFPAMVEVRIDEARGSYDIRVGEPSGPDGRPLGAWAVDGKPKPIGKEHWRRCYRDDCKSGDRDISMPGLPPLEPLGGKLKDRNHIQASISLRNEHLGRAKNGTRIEMMTVDLWRSASTK